MGVLIAALAISAWVSVQGPPEQSDAAKQKVAAVAQKIAADLEAAGFKNYRKVGDGLWVVGFRGNHSDSVDVIIQAQETMVLVFSTVQRSTQLTPDQMRQLLRKNYQADYSKIAVDNDGDLLSLMELPGDVTTEALRRAVDHVASLADSATDLLGISSKRDVAEEQIPNVAAGRGAAMPLLRGAFELSYDPAKWTVGEIKDGVTQLNHVSGELWARVISERMELEPDHFRDIVLSNAKEVDPNVAIVAETPTVVNGLRVDVLRYEGSNKGMKFTFYNQMYSDPSGTVQIAGWTAANLFQDYRRELLELFAGFHRSVGTR